MSFPASALVTFIYLFFFYVNSFDLQVDMIKIFNCQSIKQMYLLVIVNK